MRVARHILDWVCIMGVAPTKKDDLNRLQATRTYPNDLFCYRRLVVPLNVSTLAQHSSIQQGLVAQR